MSAITKEMVAAALKAFEESLSAYAPCDHCANRGYVGPEWCDMCNGSGFVCPNNEITAMRLALEAALGNVT